MRLPWITFVVTLFIICASPIEAASLRLYNNTRHTLQAEVFSADGTHLASMTLRPSHTLAWNNDYTEQTTPQAESFNSPKRSETPFRVEWICPGGTTYSTVENVATGSTVSPQEGLGPRSCPPQKKGKSLH